MIPQGIVARVADSVAEASPFLLDIDLQKQLRVEFDGLRVVVCNDDDVSPNILPALGNVRCNVYYLDASGHCVKLTREAGTASGLVVGMLADDD